MAEFTQHHPFEFSAFASDIGWAPGKFPKRVEFKGIGGNGNPFQLAHVERDSDEDVVQVTYEQIGGMIAVVIYND